MQEDEEKGKDKENALKVHNVLNNIETEKKDDKPEDKAADTKGPEMAKQ